MSVPDLNPPKEGSPKVLVVDDDASALFIYKTHLVRAGFRVLSAANVASARMVLEKEGVESFSAVVTDYWMPGATGFDLLRHLRSVDKSLAVILITAEGEKEHVAQSLREGAHNFLDKPVGGLVLREAVQKAVDYTRRQRSMKSTVEEARALGDSQRLMLGRKTSSLEGRLHFFSRPNAQAGGDFAAAYQVGTDRYVVLVSDVSGHDLRAAYYSAYLQGVAHGMLDRGAAMPAVFRRLNDLLLDDWNKGGTVDLSLAVCAAEIDLAGRSVSALNCGLPNPLICDEEGWPELLVDAVANPLGWFDEMPSVVSRPMSGGLLCFWSDGLADAAGRLGISPLALAARLHQPQVESESLLLGCASDDVVSVQIDLTPVIQPGRRRPLPLLYERYTGDNVADIDSLQAYIESSLLIALPWLKAEDLFNPILCVREMLINALKHGCQGRVDRHALLQASYDVTRACLAFRISDDGVGHLFDFEGHEVLAAEEMIPEHRGFILVKNLANRMHMSARGNRLTMDFVLQSSHPSTP